MATECLWPSQKFAIDYGLVGSSRLVICPKVGVVPVEKTVFESSLNTSPDLLIEPDNTADGSNLSSSPYMKACYKNVAKANFGRISSLQPYKSELTLLDIYSGCGGMSTGLCLGAKLSGVDLVTKWTVDNDKSACESLKLNHPGTQIRNEPAEDFLDLLKEWDKLCKKYGARIVETQKPNFRVTRGADKDAHSKSENEIPRGEYEVASFVDICYGDPNETGKRGLNFQLVKFYTETVFESSLNTSPDLLIEPDNTADGSNLSSSPYMKACYKNVAKANFGRISSLQPYKSELTLLDIYSGCGGMSTGLCLGAKLSGVDLVTKWTVDNDKSACESLKLNHPGTQIRNEPAEDFLDLLKEWDKLCKKYGARIVETQKPNFRVTRGADKDAHSKSENEIPRGEYEVASFVDICYGDPNETGKRGLNFQVRWVGYGPSEDTWESIEGLSKCQDRILDFVRKGIKSKILPRPGEVDVICGGPPCQGISGYNRFRNVDSPLDDERNRQIMVFMEIVNFLRPKYVLMENVVDILRFAKGCLARYALSSLVRMNYQSRLGIMAAGCYGLPQFRLRVFLWGAHPHERLPQFPLPTHDVVLKYGPPSEFERNVVAYDEGQPWGLEKHIVLNDAISDLPPVTNGQTRDKMSYRRDPETEFQKYIRATKSDMMGFACSGPGRTENSVLFDHRPLPLSDDDYLRVCQIPRKKGANFRDLPGIIVGTDNVVQRTEGQSLMPSGKPWVPDWAMNYCEGKSLRPFARLWWDETVPTVLCRPDAHSQAILHPEQDRVLTIRECARLQGFPDYYEFCGDMKERAIYFSKKISFSRTHFPILVLEEHDFWGKVPLKVPDWAMNYCEGKSLR
ncbi:unnamed protein product [Ilex paraguariensis]|uniref:DNA (cytosine-5-)-methyltransferase n=1 Tax=Ilex paraguariensis TaxID=185542 RepID=A0ABC8TWN8_9AQUA